jgi:hypothetical protein
MDDVRPRDDEIDHDYVSLADHRLWPGPDAVAAQIILMIEGWRSVTNITEFVTSSSPEDNLRRTAAASSQHRYCRRGDQREAGRGDS